MIVLLVLGVKSGCLAPFIGRSLCDEGGSSATSILMGSGVNVYDEG